MNLGVAQRFDPSSRLEITQAFRAVELNLHRTSNQVQTEHSSV
jgi:hypothetical protein